MNFHNRTPRTARSWHMDPGKLRPGDVILETGHTLFGRTIRAVERGQFSHALMWVGGTDFIEAVRDGARIISFARVLVTRPGDWLLLRHPDPAIASAAAIEARNLAHKGYSLGKAIATKLPLKPSASPASLFCSQLVAEAFARAGSNLVAGKVPAKITPNDLIAASILEQLGTPPLTCVELAPDELQFLDRDKAYRQSLPAQELRISREAFAAVEPFTSRLTPRPGNLAETLQALASVPGGATDVADALLHELDRRGYFALLDGLMMDIAAGTTVEGTPDAVRGWRDSAIRHRGQWQAHVLIGKTDPHPLWRRLAQLSLRNHLMFAALVEQSQAGQASKPACDAEP